MEQLTERILSLDAWVWQPFVMPLILVAVGLLLTVMTGFVQLRKFGFGFKMLTRSAPKDEAGANTITSFQALSTALA